MRTEVLKRIALGVVCLAALAAGGADKTVIRKELGYQITFPDGLFVDSSGSDVAAFSQPPAWAGFNGISVYVHSTDLKESESLRSLLINAASQKMFKGATLTDIRMVKLDGVTASKLTVSLPPQNDRIQFVIYCIVAGARGYTICIGASKADFETYANNIDTIVKSFKFIEAK